MTHDEWEALCDGCGLCCLHKLQDEDTGRVYYTAVACRLLDLSTCRCTGYLERHRQVKRCVSLDPSRAETLDWLPDTCAYRRLARGEDLPWWHPLVSGDPDTVHTAGMSARDIAISESEVLPDRFQDYIIDSDPDEGIDPLIEFFSF